MSKIKFENLKTAAGKRVRIAKDALLQLKLKQLVATPGTYLQLDMGDSDYTVRKPLTLHKFFKAVPTNKELKCEACAMGSLLCGLSKNNGDFKIQDYGIHAKLAKYFDKVQLELIENFFEGYSISGDTHFKVWSESNCGYSVDWRPTITPGWDDDFQPYIRFHDKYKNPDTRLRKILENIIANHGTFVPPPFTLKGVKWAKDCVEGVKS